METLRTYRLTLLLDPQSTREERGTIEGLVNSWVGDHHGSVQSLRTEEPRRLAYEIGHQPQALQLHAVFQAPGETIQELAARLRREKRVLRARLWHGELPSGRRVRDLPAKRPDGAALPEKKAPVKPKAPLEKLEEKIEEILEEKVL